MDPFVYTIEDGKIGGRPGPMKIPWNLQALAADGWTVLVSFECELLEPDHVKEIRALGLEHRLICVVDFTAPTIDQLFEFNEFVDAKLAEGRKVLAHCYAGRGRTGAMLAAYLIHRGMSSDAAIREIRERAAHAYGSTRGVIEPEQEETLHQYARRRTGL